MISFKLDPSHPVFTSAQFVQEHTCDTLERLKINYFQYVRCYDDGSFTLLTNSTKVLEELIQLKYPTLSYYDEALEKIPTYNFLWEETLPEKPVRDVKEKHNFHNGLTIMKRHQKYYDMIGFAMPGELSNKNSFYLNYLNILNDFAVDFMREHRDLFRHLDDHKISPPEAYMDPNRHILCLPNSEEIRDHILLSKQETKCLNLLKKGYTYKHIALKLTISPRTVETYIGRIKEKTGLTSKQDLLNL